MPSSGEILCESELEAFLAEHGDHIYTYLCVLCGEDQAADAMQNAFEKFLEQVRRGRVLKESAAQYLATIAKHDYFRQARLTGREVPFEADGQEVAAPEPVDENELARRLQLVLMETVNDPEVPPDVAAVIRLRFLEDAEIETICEKIGKSQATVYRLMEKSLGILAEACRKASLRLEDLYD